MRLTSSLDVAFFGVKVYSTKDTFNVLTRIAKPSNLPFNSGITKPTASAAPVFVGIIEVVAGRAILRCLC